MTNVGPADHFAVPSTGFALVGSTNTGPAPQMNLPGLAGEKNTEATMSPMPEVGTPPSNSAGWPM